MSTAQQPFDPPDVFITETDYDRLSELAGGKPGEAGDLLADELTRAIVLPETDRRSFVRLYSKVEFTDLLTGRSRVVQLVPPQEADMDKDRLSVLTPIGAALIGLTAGAAMAVQAADGRRRMIQVVAVEPSDACV